MIDKFYHQICISDPNTLQAKDLFSLKHAFLASYERAELLEKAMRLAPLCICADYCHGADNPTCEAYRKLRAEALGEK